jgi:putative membrane protein
MQKEDVSMDGNGMMYGYHYGMGWMVVSLVFWILLIAGAVLLVLWIVGKSGRGSRAGVEESALDILKKRYARGEITREQYEEMKKVVSLKE